MRVISTHQATRFSGQVYQIGPLVPHTGKFGEPLSDKEFDDKLQELTRNNPKLKWGVINESQPSGQVVRHGFFDDGYNDRHTTEQLISFLIQRGTGFSYTGYTQGSGPFTFPNPKKL